MLLLKDNQNKNQTKKRPRPTLSIAHCHQQLGKKKKSSFGNLLEKWISQAGEEQANIRSFGPKVGGKGAEL